MQATAQSDHGFQTSWPSALRGSQTRRAEAVVQPVPAGQKAEIKFSQATAYDSAGAFADSVAIADLNSDGKMDLVVLNYCQAVEQGGCETYGAVSVLLSNGDGTFQSAVTNGKLDLVVANVDEQSYQTGSAAVLLGNGDGTFQTAVSYGSGAYEADSVAIGDFNGDGIPDLAVANYCHSDSDCEQDTSLVGVLLGNGDGTFQPAVTYSTGDY